MADLLVSDRSPGASSTSRATPAAEPRREPPRRVPRLVQGTSRWRGILLTCIAAAGAAVVSGVWTPRGPASTAQALAAMGMGLGVGFIAGAAMRSRWSILLAPFVFVVVFELVRIDAVGPTVDRPDLSLYGLLLLAAGRLVHGILVLAPMAAGAAHSVAWFRRRDPIWDGSARHGARRAFGGAFSVVLVLLAVVIVRPATTDPIIGTDGEPLAGSIAELTRVEIGGHDQALLIRGNSVDNPVLLFLAGGPGGSEMGVMSDYGRLLEQDFVVVTWDQRGTGKSYGSFEPVETMTIEQVVADTIELTQYLAERFGDDEIYVVGESYGSFIGVLAAQQRPDLYAALVGSGQMVSATETDRMFYEDAVAHAEATGDSALLDTLESIGEPPYDDVLDYVPLVASEQLWNDYSDVEGHESRREPTGSLGVPEYTLMDQIRSMTGLADTYATLYPQLDGLDLRDAAPALDVPVYVVLGEHEARGRAVLAREWFNELDAPSKEITTVPASGHRPFVEQLEVFHQLMVDDVLADTWNEPRAGTVIASEPDPDDELLEMFGRYNPAVWPGHLIAYALGVLVLWGILRREGPTTDRLTAGLLAAMWLWLGVVFLGRYGAQFQPILSAVYGTMFVVQAGLFLRAGVVHDRLRFSARNGLAGRVGWLALGYALVVYPILGIALGHGWPESPLFGMAPCPSTIATFGLLLLVKPPLPRHLLAIPLVWAVLAPMAAVARGVPEDLGLLAIGLAAVVIVFVRDRGAHRAERQDRTRIDTVAGDGPFR